MIDFGGMKLEELIRQEGFDCECGRHHGVGLKFVRVGQNAVDALPEALAALGCRRPFVVCDRNTERAAWERVREALDRADIAYRRFRFDRDRLEPDESAVGALCMAFDPDCDSVLAIGSGVINDCCKVLAHAVGRPQLVVGTAPSMDGYASNSSSMIQNRVKVTLYNACPAAILADTEIMKDAPDRMLWAGLGDMLAKYIALCEWRISHLINGEYYCEAVAGLMRRSLREVSAAAPRLMERDPDVVGAIAEGLITSGIAMSFAQVSRPASGLEHYFSHLWEMFALDRGLPTELHGIQVGVGTCLTLRIYERLRAMRPDRAQAEAAARAFSAEAWEANVRRVFGAAAQTLIDSERERWHKNDPAARRARMEAILAHWDEILRIMDEELPDADSVIALMERTGMPTRPSQIGQSDRDVRDALTCSRDIRDKYLTSSLLWDLGLLDQFAAEIRA